MEDDKALYLLPYRGRELLKKLATGPKTNNSGMDSVADCCIPLIYCHSRSIVEPFGREKLIDSVLASCSDCRVVSLLRRQQLEKNTAAQTTKKKRHCKEQPCNYCKKVLEAQRYISKTLFFITLPNDDSVRPGEAVDVYVTGPNITMVAINSDSTKLSSTLESATTISEDCWYGPLRMNVGDTLSLTNLHAKSKPMPSSNGCNTCTSWEDLKFLLCSNNGSNGISTTNTGHSNSDPTTLRKPTIQPKLWTSLNDIQCTLSRRPLHREQQSQHSFTNNNNITQKSVALSSHLHDNSTSTEATTQQQPSHSEIAVEEESPMLTLPHFSCSSNWADNYHLNGSATEGVVVDDDDDDDVEAIGMHHLDGTPTIELGTSEEDANNNNNIIIRPLASMSFQELYELREEYAPNTFRHALLSIALMRAEKMKQDDTKSSQILLPWLLRDTVVILRKKKPFTVTTA